MPPTLQSRSPILATRLFDWIDRYEHRARLFAMNLSRHKRRLLALIGAGVMLFAQFAVAAHACMTMAPAMPGIAAENPPCHEPDSGDLNACLTHCQAGAQASSDKLPATSTGLTLVLVNAVVKSDLVAAASASHGYARSLLTRATAPPAMVRHCCLRI